METCCKRNRCRGNGFLLNKEGKGVRFNRGVSGGKQRKQGTTLIEVVLSLLILVIMVVMLIAALRHPRSMVVNTAYRQAALHAAHEALEEAVAQGYNYNYYNRTAAVPSDELDSVYSMHGRGVSGTRTVTEWNSESPPLLLITVSVEYPNSDTPVILETLL